MSKVLIFDFDGVLANSIDPMLEYAQQVCQELGYLRVPTQEDLEVLEKMEFSEYGLQLGIPQDKVDEFVSRNIDLFNNRDEPLAIVPKMDRVVVKLANSSTLAMVTGNSHVVVNKFLQAYKLKGVFQQILSVEDKGNRVEKILRLKALYDYPAGEFYFIGDSVSDIRAAHEAGINSVAVGWGHQSIQKLKKENPHLTVVKPVDLLDMFSDET